MPISEGPPHGPADSVLTRAPRRSALLARLEAACEAGKACGLVLLDLDHFRVFSQGLGSARSDEALISLATTLQVRSSKADVYWLGADRFAVWRNDGTPVQTWAPPVVKNLGFVAVPGGFGLPLQASCGGVAAGAGHGLTADELMARAELALATAKESGGGCTVAFDPDRHGRFLTQRALRLELVRGIEQGHLGMHYQPILRLADGAVAGFEALLRWQHPERGMISPGLFVPVLERDGLIHLLGDWLFEKVGAELAQLVELGQPWHPLMTINISRQQLRMSGFADNVLRLLAEAGVSAQHLGFEVTETSAIEDLDTARAQLAVWRDAGARVLIDDFGVGSSSLASLHDFPVDLLKIDRVFVQGTVVSRSRRALTKAIADVGHALGLSLVAEGIETSDELNAVMQLGCDYGQGFGLGRPAPFADCARRLTERSRTWPTRGVS